MRQPHKSIWWLLLANILVWVSFGVLTGMAIASSDPTAAQVEATDCLRSLMVNDGYTSAPDTVHKGHPLNDRLLWEISGIILGRDEMQRQIDEHLRQHE